MKHARRTAAGLVSIVALVGAAAANASADPARPSPALHPVSVCSGSAGVQCLAVALADADDTFAPATQAAGFNASTIRKIYKLKGTKSHGATVAIVAAYGYPNLVHDLAVFRKHNHLKPCGPAKGCLRVIGQNGGPRPRGSNADWDVEQALDVDALSSACPDCRIVVVEANSATTTNLFAAERTAARQRGVKAVSNSWITYGGGNNNPSFNHPGIAIVAGTGDNGHQGGGYPAADTHVVAVGGTTVSRSGKRYHETVWSGTGSGCGIGSNPKPVWQNAAGTTCGKKATADVAAAANPNAGGLNIYISRYGFITVGGTSEATPIIAGIFALSGRTSLYPARFLYDPSARKHLHDVTVGSNGGCGIPLCHARKGWDGPTGVGTPKGVGAF